MRKRAEMIVAKCDQCGTEYTTYPSVLRKGKLHFCSKACERESKKYHNTRASWRGGHIGKTTGYLYIRIDGKDVGEHILVAEKKIGRRLNPDEVVHHINGDKLDNRPENLQVMTNSEHVKLHGSRRGKTVQECARCGNFREIHGRGLCHSCYHSVLRRGELLQWGLNTLTKSKL